MADVKISNLGAISAVAGEDLVAIVDDPSGTPASRKATIDQIKTYIGGITTSSTDTFTNKSIDLTDNTLTGTSAELKTAISDETGSGSLVFATSPTLITPALGTPSALVGTSITGTASGLTAGNVTTNANLTGDVTSSGNATTIATDAVDISMLSASGTAGSTTFLRGDNAWAVVDASPLTTKGDVYTYDTGNQRLAVGADGLVLKADSSTATGLAWGSGGGGATATHAYTNQSSTSYAGTGSSGTGIDVGVAVATEASGAGEREIYIRKIDANNEGVFTVIHKNGTTVEVQIA